MKNFTVHFIIAILLLFTICFSTKANATNSHRTIKTTLAQDTLTKKNILARIKKVASKQFSARIETMKMETSFVKDYKADDLDMVELVMAFEEEFKIKIPDDQLETLTTVQKAYDYIVKALNVKK